MILVVCALPEELRFVGERSGVEIFACGVGPVEAALGTARKLALGRYRAVVNAGIAGVFRGRGSVGDALLVSDESYADFGLEGEGRLTLPGGATLRDRERADAALLARCLPLRIPLARGVTVAQVTSTDATAERLAARYRSDVESMEGFAVLRAAAVARIPALEVRGISNYVGDRARGEWNFAAGARAAAVALESVLDRLTV